MTNRSELRPPGVRIHEGPATAAPVARTNWAWNVGTVFGIGRLKPGPGTWASLAATAVWYIGLDAAHLIRLGGHPGDTGGRAGGGADRDSGELRLSSGKAGTRIPDLW